MNQPVAMILAAGKSTRMKSETPKVLHELFGKPLIEYVLDAVRAAGVGRVLVVVGHKASLVRQGLSHCEGVEFALQEQQHGTGHAVMACEPALRDHDGPVLIVAADTPMLKAQSLTALLDRQRQHSAACVIATARTADNAGLGRIVRSQDGEFLRIVEERDASADERRITEINTGCFAYDTQSLLAALRELRPENEQAEYYLTDCPHILRGQGGPVIAACIMDIDEALGINTRAQLAHVGRRLQEEFLTRLMLDGVTIVDPGLTHIDSRATIGRDTIIRPFTAITGAVHIGSGCAIGPHAVLTGPLRVPDGTVVGPFRTPANAGS